MQISLFGEKLLAHGIQWNHRLVIFFFYNSFFLFEMILVMKSEESVVGSKMKSHSKKSLLNYLSADLSVTGWRPKVSFVFLDRSGSEGLKPACRQVPSQWAFSERCKRTHVIQCTGNTSSEVRCHRKILQTPKMN